MWYISTTLLLLGIPFAVLKRKLKVAPGTDLGFVFMKKHSLMVALIGLVMALASCSAPHYLALPSKVPCHAIKNTCSFGIQNMDEQAKIENEDLISHYDGFDVKYTISDDFTVSFTIINNSGNDLLIDKSQCFVLYAGNATQLFKDIHMTGNTTFNDVQGAINNVQTSHGSIMAIIPSYSKWTLPLSETNIRNVGTLPEFCSTSGTHSLSQYDNPETVEFIIPYSFDATMRKWKTSRNRIFVNRIVVENETLLLSRIHGNIHFPFDSPGHYYSDTPYKEPKMISTKEYIFYRYLSDPDFSEVDRNDATNQKLYRKRKGWMIFANSLGCVVTAPTIIGAYFFGLEILYWGLDGKEEYLPPK